MEIAELFKVKQGKVTGFEEAFQEVETGASQLSDLGKKSNRKIWEIGRALTAMRERSELKKVPFYDRVNETLNIAQRSQRRWIKVYEKWSHTPDRLPEVSTTELYKLAYTKDKQTSDDDADDFRAPYKAKAKAAMTSVVKRLVWPQDLDGFTDEPDDDPLWLVWLEETDDDERAEIVALADRLRILAATIINHAGEIADRPDRYFPDTDALDDADDEDADEAA